MVSQQSDRGYNGGMGATHVTVAVSNPGDPKRRWEGLFLVDTGAIDCMVPGNQLRAIGVEPRGKRTYELADGSEIIMEIGVATVEFMGEIVGATIIFGQDNVEPILGVTALESVGIEVDPQNQRLKRLPAVRLKHLS
jgi:clan AA aspartic protease